MRTRGLFISMLLMSMGTLACGFVGGAFSATPTKPQAVATRPPIGLPVIGSSGETITLTTTPLPSGPIEGIVLTAPLPGQGARHSIHVEGIGDPAFEQQLGVLVRNQMGKVVGSATAKIQADVGQRGKFVADVQLPAYVPTQPGRVIVYATSARDGGLTHLSSVDVQLNGDALSSVTTIDPNRAESIVINSPVPNSTAHRAVTVSGVSDPTFEQTLIVEVRGQNDISLGRATAHINADAGQRGPFTVDVSFYVFGDPPGRVVVYSISPRDGKTVHLSSVEVNLQPY